MTAPLTSATRGVAFSILLALASPASAQDGTIYPLAAPAEPKAIPLNTGGVDGQTAQESWFRQWGDPMARNVSKAASGEGLASVTKTMSPTREIALCPSSSRSRS